MNVARAGDLIYCVVDGRQTYMAVDWTDEQGAWGSCVGRNNEYHVAHDKYQVVFSPQPVNDVTSQLAHVGDTIRRNDGRVLVVRRREDENWHGVRCVEDKSTGIEFNARDNEYVIIKRAEQADTISKEFTATDLVAAVKHLTKQKDDAYGERNQLVSFISKLFPASLERHEPSNDDWDDDWRWVVYIDLPTGQVSWHIHDSELPNFSHLSVMRGRRWDGHTVAEKYARLRNYTPRKTVSKLAAMTHEDIAEMNDLPR